MMSLSGENRSRLLQAIEAHGFEHASGYLLRTAKQIVALSKKEADRYPQIGNSRIGGEPDLPEMLEWPTDSDGDLMSFVLQLNAAELEDTERRLPTEGVLFFFVGDYGLEVEHRVLYASARQMEGARRTAAPGELKLEENGPYRPFKLNAQSSLELPGYAYVDEEAVESEEHGWEEYEDLNFALHEEDERPVVKMFGYAEGQHGDDEYMAALELFGCESTYDPTEAIERLAGALGGDPELARREVADILMLAEIDSDDDVGFMWGDAGVLHFFIRKEDLLRGRFDRTYCSYYSS
ncbi:YwqG family protein [Saccharibacillus sp. CPCC 101409]|uniref:YwqG family protein n=1 Tax=Saccharibacillus sp. CPCC 101409 TaxID=3058041 RepID=UPI0026741403|nr:YwqG family protein [Saccharibacillus sp. CPCC 101409]MDO3410811.1 YwqG family protein [Saccharibacillus sp. CPCC 101409]